MPLFRIIIIFIIFFTKILYSMAGDRASAMELTDEEIRGVFGVKRLPEDSGTCSLFNAPFPVKESVINKIMPVLFERFIKLLNQNIIKDTKSTNQKMSPKIYEEMRPIIDDIFPRCARHTNIFSGYFDHPGHKPDQFQIVEIEKTGDNFKEQNFFKIVSGEIKKVTPRGEASDPFKTDFQFLEFTTDLMVVDFFYGFLIDFWDILTKENGDLSDPRPKNFTMENFSGLTPENVRDSEVYKEITKLIRIYYRLSKSGNNSVPAILSECMRKIGGSDTFYITWENFTFMGEEMIFDEILGCDSEEKLRNFNDRFNEAMNMCRIAGARNCAITAIAPYMKRLFWHEESKKFMIRKPTKARAADTPKMTKKELEEAEAAAAAATAELMAMCGNDTPTGKNASPASGKKKSTGKRKPSEARAGAGDGTASTPVSAPVPTPLPIPVSKPSAVLTIETVAAEAITAESNPAAGAGAGDDTPLPPHPTLVESFPKAPDERMQIFLLNEHVFHTFLQDPEIKNEEKQVVVGPLIAHLMAISNGHHFNPFYSPYVYENYYGLYLLYHTPYGDIYPHQRDAYATRARQYAKRVAVIALRNPDYCFETFNLRTYTFSDDEINHILRWETE
jgi:hypothetical protein